MLENIILLTTIQYFFCISVRMFGNMCDVFLSSFHSRCFSHWYTRDVSFVVKGYKLNLQQVMGSKMPNSVLQFMMKHTYFRRVRGSTRLGTYRKIKKKKNWTFLTSFCRIKIISSANFSPLNSTSFVLLTRIGANCVSLLRRPSFPPVVKAKRNFF